MDRRFRLSARSSAPRLARTIRHRLLLGRDASHGSDVASTGERRTASGTAREVIHCDLQRSGWDEPPLDNSQAALQPFTETDQVFAGAGNRAFTRRSCRLAPGGTRPESAAVPG